MLWWLSVMNCIVTVLCNLSIKMAITIATEKTNAMATNVVVTASINCHSRKSRNSYILHKVLLIDNFYFLVLFKHWKTSVSKIVRVAI